MVSDSDPAMRLCELGGAIMAPERRRATPVEVAPIAYHIGLAKIFWLRGLTTTGNHIGKSTFEVSFKRTRWGSGYGLTGCHHADWEVSV
jgi:hypothetical protein